MIVPNAPNCILAKLAAPDTSWPCPARRQQPPRRLSGALRTLIFPCAVTAVDFLNTLINPLAAGGSLAYSQPDQLPLQQIVAITGMWGLTFLIAWSAAAVNMFWEAGFACARPARASCQWCWCCSAVRAWRPSRRVGRAFVWPR